MTHITDQIIFKTSLNLKIFQYNRRIYTYMFQVKSYKSPNDENSLKNVFNQMCTKIDFQIQCNFNDLSLNSNTNNRHNYHHNQPLTKSIHINSNKNSIHKYGIRDENMNKTINKFYGSINIKIVNQHEDKIVKILEGVAMGKKYDEIQMRILKEKVVYFNTIENLNQLCQYTNDNGIIRVTMENIYQFYLQFHKENLREAKLQGKLNTRIVRPFLILFEKIKQDSSNIVLDWHMKGKSKTIDKNEMFKIFYSYLPKQELTKQLEKTNLKHSKIYEEMYEKYENIPFQLQEQKVQQHSENDISQLNELKMNKLSSSNEQTSKVAEELEQYVLEHKKFQEEQSDPESKQSRQSKIRQRFEDRFKRQLKNLSDDANSILRARNDGY